MKKLYKVLLVVRNLAIGGAERHVVNIVRNVDPAQISLSVCILVNDVQQYLLPEIEQVGVPVFISPYYKNDPRVLGWLAGVLRRENMDVAHSFLWRSDAVLALVSKLFGYQPIICTERGDRTLNINRGGLFRSYDRLVIFKQAVRICANSQFGAQALIKLGCAPEKIDIISNGIDLLEIEKYKSTQNFKKNGLPDNCHVIGCVSRLEQYKGVDTIIKAIHEIRRTGLDNVYLTIIGDGPYRKQLETLCEQLGIQERIIFTGFQVPAIGWIKGFEVGLLANELTEHCSNSILEYMACGKPVIATRVGGNPELVTHNKTGLLVAPGDHISMAEAIKYLIEHPDIARHMGELGRARIENEFNMQTIASRYIDLWQKVVR